MTFKIDAEKIKKVYTDAVDFMMESDLFSNNAYLYYPPIKVECDQCSNTTTFGCTNCNGSGFREVTEREQIRLRIHFSGRFNFNRQNFRKLGINIEDPKGDVLTLCNCSDSSKILSANYIHFFEDNQHQTFRYKLLSPPTPYGFCRDKYCYCIWEKDNNA